MQNIDLDLLLDSIRRGKIGIIGDFCLDVYWQINMAYPEISVETKLPTRPVSQQSYSLGGAGNVATNLAALGVEEVALFGVIGDDPFGQQMTALSKAWGLDTEALLTQEENWSTHVYIKPFENQREGSRLDFGNANELAASTADKLLLLVENSLARLDLMLINQQVISGIHTTHFQERLNALIRRNPEKIFIIDSRHLSAAYPDCWHKMNDIEAPRLCGIRHEPDDLVLKSAVEEAALSLFERWRTPLFITRGKRGCLLVREGKITTIPGLFIPAKIDPVGAGDSMLAGIAAVLASRQDCRAAAMLGNLVAGVTIQKLHQTGTATPEEIRQLGKNIDYIYHPEKAEDIRTALYWRDADIEIVENYPAPIDLKHIIFDHDGTLSTLREGWEKVMELMMMKAILGDKYDAADETLYQRVKRRVENFIDETTGLQTLVQMQQLVHLVEEFGCIPGAQILSEQGYKEIYNDALMAMVRQRIEKLKKGELDRFDFALKGVHDFLQTCYDRGIKLYLASGTDEADVIEEAGAMGYAELFEGRIYGALGDAKKEAKRMVMDRITGTIGAGNANQIAAIGDGPVEIREMRKRNGLAIGIASDEVRRFGLNPNKRSRLIRAGAHFIIADYSQGDKLYSLLDIK